MAMVNVRVRSQFKLVNAPIIHHRTPCAFTMSATRYEFKDPELITEFDIRPPGEGSGKKTDVAHCHHCPWNQALHAARMKQHLGRCANYKTKQANEGKGESAAAVVLAARNYESDSYWKQLGFDERELGILAAPAGGSITDDTRPELSPKQKDGLAMSATLAVIMGARPLRMHSEEDFRIFLTTLSGFKCVLNLSSRKN
jgi:hypothetical protein